MPGRGVGTSVRQGRGGRTGSRGRGGRTGIIGGLHPPTPVKLRSRSTGGASGATPLYVNSSAVKAAVESSGSSGSSTPTTSPSTVRQSLSRPNPNPVAQANGFEVYANQDAINAQRRSKLGSCGDGAVSAETTVADAVRAEKLAEVRLENQMLKQAIVAAQVALFGAGADGGGISGMLSAASLLSVRSNSRRRSFEVPIEAFPEDALNANVNEPDA